MRARGREAGCRRARGANKAGAQPMAVTPPGPTRPPPPACAKGRGLRVGVLDDGAARPGDGVRRVVSAGQAGRSADPPPLGTLRRG